MPTLPSQRIPSKRWLLWLALLFPLLLGLFCFFGPRSRPATTILIVPSAETQSSPRHDPPLSVMGLERAWTLAQTAWEAGITIVYATDSRSARQTAQPLATKLSLPIRSLPSDPPDRLSNSILSEHRGSHAAPRSRPRASASNPLRPGSRNRSPQRGTSGRPLLAHSDPVGPDADEPAPLRSEPAA